MSNKISNTLFDYYGRSSRVNFVLSQLLAIAVMCAITAVAVLTMHISKIAFPDQSLTIAVPVLLSTVGTLLFFYSSVCIVIRRLHDMDLSGIHVAWIVVLYTLIAGWAVPGSMLYTASYVALGFAYVVLALIPGTLGTNRYDDENTTNK